MTTEIKKTIYKRGHHTKKHTNKIVTNSSRKKIPYYNIKTLDHILINQYNNNFISDKILFDRPNQKTIVKTRWEEKTKNLNSGLNKISKIYRLPGDPNVENKKLIDILGIDETDFDIFNKILSAPYLRSIVSDFNLVFMKDGAESIVPKTASICKQKSEFLEKEWNNMCFYCGKKMGNERQCDHVIPIINMVVYIDNDTLINNFWPVHSVCNSKATDMDIRSLWLTCGTSYFSDIQSLQVYQDAYDFSKPGGGTTRDEYCRGFLYKNVLSKIKFRPERDYATRIHGLSVINEEVRNIIQKVKTYLSHREQADLLLNISRTHM